KTRKTVRDVLAHLFAMSPVQTPLVGEGGSARSAETDEGCWTECGGAKLEHPSSVAFGDTFSHKGRRRGGACHATITFTS
ncbi:hypothetical protein, partial [Mesorhizobium captivum]|uniref:hypothetical protein n=1 Tax=Mesorhizobium captivum TaxID=3072319 RepID=UPI002A23F2A0